MAERVAPRQARGAGGAVHAAPGLVGVLGGMGPLATVDFLHKLVACTPATLDQDHVPVVVSSIPQVPDRTAAYRGLGASPVPAMIGSGRRLVAAGAELVVVPCNTAHLWFDEVLEALQVPMLHIVDATLAELQDGVRPGAPIGLLATDATLMSGLYARRASAGAANGAWSWLLPTVQERHRWLRPGIGAVKAGRLDDGARDLLCAARALLGRGAQALVLACTEIPLVLDAARAGVPVVDATAALARATVAWSLAQRPARNPH